jgi:nucleotidyltransferase substrate binding protein (TIGR01987 family)
MESADQDIRWEQRFSNYRKAFAQLKKFIDKGDLSDLEEQGLIKAFEYTYELAWNTMKDYLKYQGSENNITGSRDAFREAFKAGLISNGELWMDMLQSRNKTSHSYNEETADEIVEYIFSTYYELFVEFEATMENLRSGPQSSLFGKE